MRPQNTMSNTPFTKFADTCERLASTSKRLEKVAILADFLLSLSEEELRVTSLLVLGKAFPDTESRALDVSWRTLQKFLSKGPLVGKHTADLTILEVSRSFDQIAEMKGKGSRQKIVEALETLFGRVGEAERKYLVKIILGEMRIGVAQGLLFEGIAKAANVPLTLVRRASMFQGHPGEVAVIALKSGSEGLKKVRLEMFRPVQPMLAGLAEEFSKVFIEHGESTSLEFKFDGARVQIHKQEDQIRIYSRHLTDVTASLPDLVKIIKRRVSADRVIVEGEVVAVGDDERPLPFQELMRRFRRVHDIDTLIRDVPIRLYLFDLLYFAGDSHVDSPYTTRMELLEKCCRPDILVRRLVTGEEKEAEEFLQQALDQGHEGLMAKRLDSDYVPGARGKKWFKIKPAETLDLVIIAADWGSGRRVGWLSNYHLAAKDVKTGEFLDLGKTFKGLTDMQFKWMTDKLLSLKVREGEYTVYVKPEVVVEVAFNEIQRSSHYNSKFALRFARIKRIREDKTPGQADTIERVRSLYEKQFEQKARVGKE
ncbi:ATP-dependent DNA ligase [bacterium]|nr:ATP-dependent DNA ligase [bacterium]